jgi:serine/threonine protein kinase
MEFPHLTCYIEGKRCLRLFIESNVCAMDELGFGDIFGPYHLINMMSMDSSSSLYIGEHEHYKRVIIKIFHAQFTESEAALFIQNAGVLTRLRHPHLLDVVEVGVTHGHPFAAMEYTPYTTLRQRYPVQSRATLEDVLPYARQIAQALDYLHMQALVYAELTPEHVWLSPVGQVLLGDVGIAALVQRIQHASAGTLDGTIGYLAPEQINGQACAASDQYALAIMLYEWLCGTCPFNGTMLEVASKHLLQPVPSLREQVPTISPAVEQVVLTALEKDPRRRFPSVGSFIDALERAYQSVPHSAPNQGKGISQIPFPRAEQPVSVSSLPEANQLNASPTEPCPPLPRQEPTLPIPVPSPPALSRPSAPGMSAHPARQGFNRTRVTWIVVVIVAIILGVMASEIYAAFPRKSPPSSNPSSQVLIAHTFSGIYAINAQTGTILWRFEETSFAPPVVANGQVYSLLANSATSSSPEIVAVDEMSGKLRWSYPVSNSFGRLGVAGDIVVAAIWTQEVLGLHARTGAKLWQMTIDDMVSPGLLTVSGETVLVPTSLGVEDAIDATSGHILWDINQGSSESAAVPGTIYIPTYCGSSGINSANFCLGAYDSISGARRWLSPAGQLNCAAYVFCNTTIPLDNETLVGGNVVYQIYDTMLSQANSGISQAQGLDAFDANTGRLLWQYMLPPPTSTPGQPGSGVPNNTLAGSSGTTFYLEDSNGTLMGLSTSNHTLLWKYNDSRGKAEQFIESDGVLALMYADAVVALDSQTGSKLWSEPLS